MAKTVRTMMAKQPVAEVLPNPDAPVPEQVRAWRDKFLHTRFFPSAAQELPLMIVGRTVVEGEDIILAGTLPTKDHVAPFIEYLLEHGARWVISIAEAYTYDTVKQGNEQVKNPATKRECLVIAAYAEGWREVAVQHFSRSGGKIGVPRPTAEMVVLDCSGGAELTGGMIPFSDDSPGN